MAYNLQLETVPDASEQDENHGEDSKGDSSSTNADSSQKDRNEESCHTNESSSIKSEDGDKDDNESMEDEDENESPAQELLAPLTSYALKKQSPRKASVSTRKLELHETLAARLDRIEGDKDKVKLDLFNLKKMVEQMNAHNEPLSTSPMHLEESLAELQQRLISLEKFLSGFGATTFDTLEEDDSQEDDMLNGNTSTTDDQIDNHQGESNTISTKRKRDTNDEEDREDEVEGSSLELNEIDDPNLDDISATSLHKTDDSNVVTLTLSNNNNIVNSHPNKDKSKKSFEKSQGLLMHLLDQEQRFKENLHSMMVRVVRLEEEISNSVGSGESLENLSSKGGNVTTNENLNTTTFDDSILITQIGDIRGALDELRTKVNSKLSEQSNLAQLELQRSSDVLTQMEGGNEQIDEAVLKRLHHLLQNEIDLLREQKVDKDCFQKEMEECIQNLTNTFSKSLSEQDSKFMNNATKLEIDISDCKENLRVLENLVEAKYSDGEELNLDEKIKNATDAMELSLITKRSHTHKQRDGWTGQGCCNSKSCWLYTIAT